MCVARQTPLVQRHVSPPEFSDKPLLWRTGKCNKNLVLLTKLVDFELVIWPDGGQGGVFDETPCWEGVWKGKQTHGLTSFGWVDR